jgi:hypothetical protein
MSTPAVSSTSIYQELQTYFQQRSSDVQQLGQDLSSGNLASAQQDFGALQALGQTGPSAKGDVFESKVREQDLTAIGQALTAGNLADAQQAFAQLQSTYHHAHSLSSVPTATSSSPSSTGSIYDQIRAFFKERRADVKQLGLDLASGDSAAAANDYAALEALGQGGPFKNGGAFNKTGREQDLNAIGTALQSGDLAGAQQAFAQLEATFQKHYTEPPVYQPPASSSHGTNAPKSEVKGTTLNTVA